MSLKKKKKKKPVFKVAILCVFVGEGRVVVMAVYGGGSVGVLMRFVWRSLGVGRGVLGWAGVGVYLGCGWVGGWVR